MGDTSWDSEDFVIPTQKPPVVTDKWDGEDEEDELKDNWDDDEEAKDSSPTTEVKVVKKKKKIGEILAEKEKRRKEEMERKAKEREEENKVLSAEEILSEKLRLQKVQEDSDLLLLTEIMGTKKDNEKEKEKEKEKKEEKEKEKSSLNDFELQSEEDLQEFREALVNKIRNTDRLERGPYYVHFVEDLCRSMCENIEIDDVKRIITVLNSLYNEKVKASKASKGKKKGGSKVKLNSGQGAIVDSFAGSYDDYDDFI